MKHLQRFQPTPITSEPILTLVIGEYYYLTKKFISVLALTEMKMKDQIPLPINLGLKILLPHQNDCFLAYFA